MTGDEKSTDRERSVRSFSMPFEYGKSIDVYKEDNGGNHKPEQRFHARADFDAGALICLFQEIVPAPAGLIAAEETEDVQAEAGAAEEIAEPTAEKTEAVIDETESEEETPALKTIQEAVEEIVEEHAAETVEMISDISEEDKLEAERVASEVAMAEEERLIEEERLAAAEQHAAEEAELKRIAAEEKKADDKIVEEKKTEEKKTKRRSKAAAKTEAKTETAAPKRGTRKAKEEDRMPDLETEISRNDAYSGLSEDTTYITAKTVIVGNIETEDDIDVIPSA